jgi:1-acyl-sn-glycerol-3-phosphate acyltransferase
MRLLGSYPIERDSADRAAIRAGLRFLSRGEPLILFPEGTRSLDGRLQPIRGGIGLLAAKSGVPIVPLYISGAHRLLPKGKLLPRPGRILVLIGAPFYPENYRCPDSAREWYDRITGAVDENLHGLQDEADRVWNSERAMIGHAEDTSR